MIGTLLLPNEYMVRNGNSTTGLILEVRDDLWGKNYRVFLSPSGITKWLGEDTIRNLFEIHPCKLHPYHGILGE